MGPFKKISNFFKTTPAEEQRFVPKFNNNAGVLGSDYGSWLRSGHKGIMLNNTAEVRIEPKHLYRGYGYGIIRSVVNSGISNEKSWPRKMTKSSTLIKSFGRIRLTSVSMISGRSI